MILLSTKVISGGMPAQVISGGRQTLVDSKNQPRFLIEQIVQAITLFAQQCVLKMTRIPALFCALIVLQIKHVYFFLIKTYFLFLVFFSKHTKTIETRDVLFAKFQKEKILEYFFQYILSQTTRKFVSNLC